MSDSVVVKKLLDKAHNTTGDGLEITQRGPRSIQTDLTGTGAISALVYIDVSLDGLTWQLMATFTLSGSDSVTEGFAFPAPWNHIRARSASVIGTNAAVSVQVGY